MEPLLPNVDAVLFDLDGTLVDTNIDFPLMKRRIVSWGAGYGVSSGELALLDILSSVDHVVGCVALKAGDGKAANARIEAAEILEEIEVGHAKNAVLVPFANELICRLRALGISIGIVTRNCRKASELSLSLTDIRPDVLVCREDVKHYKPHPEQLFYALELFDANPASSIMVGDYLFDIEGGKAAGMKTIALLRDGKPPDFFDRSEPDFVAKSLEEVFCAIVDSDS